MHIIEILLQGEHIPDIQVVELGRGKKRVCDILERAASHRSHAVAGDFLAFVENEDVPLDPDADLPATEPGKPLRFHVHRCRSVAVDVTFNGMSREHRFGPATTVHAVKLWAAIKGYDMTPVDAAEHVLQLSGTTTRPELDTHIGALVSGSECRIGFDLVPLKRVEG